MLTRPQLGPRSQPIALIAVTALSACFSRGGLDPEHPPDLSASMLDLASPRPDAAADLASCPPRSFATPDGCVPCSVLVPTEQPTVGMAMATVTAPANVCILPGTYKEALALRSRVSLVGSGAATVIEGTLSVRELASSDAAPARVQDLRLVFPGLGGITSCPADMPSCSGTTSVDLQGKTLALHVQRVTFDGGQGGTAYCMEVEASNGHMDLTALDNLCRSNRGMRLRLDATDKEPLRAQFRIERNRFQPQQPSGASIYDSIELLLFSFGASPLQPGSIAQADIRNNDFFRTSYHGVYLVNDLGLDAADQARARVVLAHNTMLSGDGEDGVWDNSKAGRFPLLVSANNLYFGAKVAHAGRPPERAVNNLQPSESPFVDAMGGDLHLKPGVPAIDAADPMWAPSDDRDRRPRPVDGLGKGRALPDVGAFEYSPPVGPGPSVWRRARGF